MTELHGSKFMLGDITNGEDILKFQQLIGLKPVDVVLSDVAPEISGDPVYDNYHVQNLNNHVLAASNRILRPGGSLLLKTFYGVDEPGQFKFFQTLFKEFYRVKPNASRKRSSEVYYLGTLISTQAKATS
jgi:23S rRNA (uridine2552-2'-O)-methyltransferase